VLLKKLDDMAELIALYHDQPLTLERTSEYLGIKKTTLYQWMHKNKIPYYRPAGKLVFFSRLELNKWAFMHKIMTKEVMNKKPYRYVSWGKPEWDYRDYELVYKRKE
jgi:excisionase family DNA binding protein